jgi:hypothetical protein
LGGAVVRKGYNFALIFKSTDPEALTKVARFINERVADSRIVFSAGPTDRFLWILQQKGGDWEDGQPR